MSLTKSSIISLTIVGTLLLLFGAFITLGGIVYNGPNIPAGLYMKVDKPLAIGRVVVFCPPNRSEFKEARDRAAISAGSCPDNFGTMMLKVAAKRKDSVSINENGVFVNEMLLPQSKPLAQDREGRPMPIAKLDHYELKQNEILLMSDSKDYPFDGRYFGLLDVEQVDSVISRILP